jgi:biopolymer transport protein ExbD
MGGSVDLGAGGGARAARRSVDSEINMVPMIDLLMVTISFLLITAVWTHLSRIDADARVPGAETGPAPPPEKQLHVMMQSPDKFVLVWKQGATAIDSAEVPRREVWTREGATDVVRFPDLAAKLETEWRARGQHANPADPKADQAVLHAGDATEYKYLIGAIDAIYQPRRDVRAATGRVEQRPAFNVVFAMN